MIKMRQALAWTSLVKVLWRNGSVMKWFCDESTTCTCMKMTRGTTGNRHVEHPWNATCSTSKVTRGPIGTRHVDKKGNDTWVTERMTHGRIEKGHMEKLEDDTRRKTNWHMSVAHIATWTVSSSPRRYPLLGHVLPTTSPASVDEATWSASVSYGACQRRRAHVDPGIQWRFSDASTKQNLFRDKISFPGEKNHFSDILAVSSRQT